MIDLRRGDSLTELKKMPSESIDMVITSPPYWSLRSYLPKDHPDKAKEIGSEPTFKEYLDKIMLIFAEVKRVLKKEGSFWLNMGDSYGGVKIGKTDLKVSNYVKDEQDINKDWPEMDKCLIGQPWRMAIRCVDELGLILRADVNWCKQILIYKKNEKRTMGSVMPSSVKDRVNMASEHLFHFVKSKKYYYDIDAVRIPCAEPNIERPRIGQGQYLGKFAGNPDAESFNSPRARTQRYNIEKEQQKAIEIEGKIGSARGIESFFDKYGGQANPNGKNIPNNWLIGTEPSREHHFAKFPSMLCEIPILATCPKEICKGCGFIRERITETSYKIRAIRSDKEKHQNIDPAIARPNMPFMGNRVVKEIGYTSCPCEPKEYEPGIVMDIFAGSGTVGVVAKKLNRSFIGIELNENYIALAKRKINNTQSDMFAGKK